MKKLTLTILLLAYSTSLFAQKISGTVIDTTSAPLSYATVVLLNASDTTQVEYTLTDDSGEFSFAQDPNGGYLLHTSLVGYKPHYQRATAQQTITLNTDATQIEGVEVKATRPVSKMTPSGMQTTVEGTILSELGTGDEVLQRIPMLSGKDGVYEVFGRGNAVIYINNREVRDPSEIDNLNSSDIESVEVITNPGARYDASVMAVILIKTSRKQGDGFSFNVRSSFYTWENQDYINQLNTNFRTGGLDIFANLYFSDITNFNRGIMRQTITLDTLWMQENTQSFDSHVSRLNGTVGANYQIDDNHSVGARLDYRTTPLNNNDLYFPTTVYADGVLFDEWENNDHKVYKEDPSPQLNAYYAGKVGGLTIDFNADYLSSKVSSQNTTTEHSERYGDRVLHSTSDVGNSLWATKLQLAYPVWKGELFVGTEYTDITRSDVYENEDLVGFSSSVGIAEQNLALFAGYQAATEIGNFSLGMRYEDVSYNYTENGTLSTDKSRQYDQWFPNASYSNRFGDVSLRLSYDSKVIRPSYQSLSNNVVYANRFTLQTGNPNLKPTTLETLSLSGVWKFIQAQLSYTNMSDAVIQWAQRAPNDPKVTVLTWVNFEKMPQLTAYLSLSPVFGFWRPQLSGGVQKVWQDYSAYGIDVDTSDPIYFANFNNLFVLPNDFTINLDGSYISPGFSQAAAMTKPNFKLSCGVSKSFFNKALQVKLAFDNIVNPLTAAAMYMPNYTIYNESYYDGREVSLTLRFYFNSANDKYKGTGAGSDAKSRF